VQTAHLGDHRQRRRRRPRGVRRRARSAVPLAAAHRAQHPGVARRGCPPSPLRAGRPRARGPAGRLAVRPRSPRRSGVLRAPRLRRRRNLNGPDPRPELGGRGGQPRRRAREGGSADLDPAGSGRWGREFQRRRTTRPDEPRVRRRIDVRQRRHGLAARDGTELNASTPSAKVNLDVDGVDETIRCAVALPVISEGGPHVSIRKQSADALTPVDLIDRGRSLPIWSPCCGCCTSTAGRPLRRADRRGENDPAQRSHPFIPFDDRPVSIDEGLARSGSRTRPGCRSRRATTRTRTRP